MNKYICSLVAFLFGAVTACTDIDSDFRQTDDSYMTITVTIPGAKAPSTRSIADGNGEAKVNTIDLIVFENNGEGETFAQHVIGENITQSTSIDQRYNVQFKARLDTNPRATTIAIVANAATQVKTAVASGGSKASILEALKVVSTSSGTYSYKWIAESSSKFTPIPMYGEYSLGKEGITPLLKVEDVELIRMLARIDVVNNSSNFTITSVRVVNFQTTGYIAPAWNSEKPMIPTSPGPRLGTSNALSYPLNGGLTGTIYTYEALPTTGEVGTDGHTKAMCLIVEGKIGANIYFYRIDFTDTGDSEGNTPDQPGFDSSKIGYIPVLRNHLYKFTLSNIGVGYTKIDDALSSLGIMNNLKVSLMVVDEGLITDYVFNGDHYLGVELPDTFGVYTETKGINISTNFPLGWEIVSTQYDSGGTNWLTATKVTSGAKLQLKTTNNMYPIISRVAYVNLKAGPLTHRVKVVQKWDVIGIGTLATTYSYVGAFWRHNQCGERLIRIAQSGSAAFSVRVWDYGGFEEGDIVFSTTSTTDGGVTYVAGTETHKDPDEGKEGKRYFVDSDDTSITGNASGGYIYFRIGLKSTIEPHQHRYARLMIVYNNGAKYQMLYLRQGDAPDYLMRPKDNNSSGTITTEWGGTAENPRPYARKFSPYNLTAPVFKALATATQSVKLTIPVSSVDDHLTSYPSQAGAHYQWAPNYDVYAFNPATPWNTSKPTAWSITTYSGYWNSFKTNVETCPPGYRRPTDGSETNSSSTKITLSEMRQSLWLNPQNSTTNNVENSSFGFYADGYFDRRAIVSQTYTHFESAGTIGQSKPVSTAGSITSTGAHGAMVAYCGRIFYNPITHNHLFFPFAGFRTNRSYTNTALNTTTVQGILSYMNNGGEGHYWSSSSTSAGGLKAQMSSSNASNRTGERYVAASIRCVLDE